MLKLDTTVIMAGYTWKTGKELVNCEVTLGSAERSSSCKITLADPQHKIAEALINHSLKTGGIVELEKPEPLSNSNATLGGSIAGSGRGDTKGWASAAEHAFADACVKRETLTATTDIPKSYLSKNGNGYMSPSEIAPGAGFPASAGTTQNIGRYQLNRADWSDAVKAGFAKDFTPADQDGIFRYKLYKVNRGGKALTAGDINSAFERAADEWVSIPWAKGRGGNKDQVQPGTTKQEYLDYYKQQLAVYGGANAQTAAAPASVAPAKAPSAPSKTDTATPVIKGSVITVTINGYSFDFFHQGTEMSQDGTTVLTGQGLRWLMSRRQRSRTLKDTSLKQMATAIAKEHKVTLKYEATFDPSYSHIDQSGISDYKLLLREAEQSGLLVTESKTELVIKEREKMGAPIYTLERGKNLISYKITDTALAANADDISSKLPTANKSVIDPITGKHVSTKQDIDRNKSSNSVTGKVKPSVGGTLKTSDNISSQLSKAKTKRVAGLPSTFVVPMSDQTLSFSPLTTMLTKGFPGCLDRIWIVKTVSHDVAEGVSTLVLNSPVEALDTGSSPKGGNQVFTKVPYNQAGYVYPCSGTITSVQFELRGQRKHNGTDIGGSGMILAVADGTVVANQFQADGAGNLIVVKHPDGLFSRYFHLASPPALKVGTVVRRGEQIGVMGSTGSSTGVHLHFELGTELFYAYVGNDKLFPKMAKRGSIITAGELASSR